eukprot:TRINITY_DN837_c0_g1_i1.p1 TRINITY_DN837_c0_g1~~TRINITY_DN837_c0_g1_i1.p1  ORF type:complete len:339 (+),score=58.54 TRINITY_DN837_c0_g1_i1:61-1077(+)
MGCVEGTEVDPEQIKKSKQIEKFLKEDNNKVQQIKLLLLGTGASGKSTLAKQMRILFLNGFQNEKERSVYTELVYYNILSSIKTLVIQASMFKYALSKENENIGDEFKNMTIQMNDIELTEERAKGIKNLWKDESIQKTFERQSEYQLDDCCSYFFNNLDRIVQPKYIPTLDDILQVRAKTSGISETVFGMKGKKNVEIKIVDVGGQRNERKKWIHCFESVTALIFVVAASEYNQVLEEDPTTNRMHESIKLFNEIVNGQFFKNTDVILFINKKDLFHTKIQKISLKAAFEDYDEEFVIKSIKKRQQRRAHVPSQRIRRKVHRGYGLHPRQAHLHQRL